MMSLLVFLYIFSWFFFFKQKTAYEMRISDWSSDVCSSDLIVLPGQATSYYIGMQKIVELRTRAREALEDKFDLRAFHDVALGAGPMPLPLLEERIDAWIVKGGQAA